jgi:hypothetical protein
VGTFDTLPAAGTLSKAFRGLLSPTSFVKKTVTGYFFPSIEVLIGISINPLLPTTSPFRALDFAMPNDLLYRCAPVAKESLAPPVSTDTNIDVPTTREVKFFGASGTFCVTGLLVAMGT